MAIMSFGIGEPYYNRVLPIIPDPGDGGDISATGSGLCLITQEAEDESRVWLDPVYEGQLVVISIYSYEGEMTIDMDRLPVGPIPQNTYTISGAGQYLVGFGVNTSTGLRWWVQAWYT